ncbi:hypothetical protein LJR143_001864 [Pseudoxanthomonas sp. LjRoot143]|uniref:hypothetical protein n=1 Tax=Pseudoxanthomonas sp. LjRoot143 TaxID=3342266 RepID=UPI003ED05CAE
MQKSPRKLADAIANAMRDADSAQPYRERYNSGLPAEYRHLGPDPTPIPTSMVRGTTISMTMSALPPLFDKSGRLRRAPKGAPAGVSSTLSGAVSAQSVVGWAGAHVLVMAQNLVSHAVDNAGAVATHSVPVEFRLIEPAKFGVVDVDAEDDAPIIELPVAAAAMKWEDAVTLATRFEIPRSERRRHDPQDLESEIATALSLGVARAADETLLASLAAGSLTPFTLAKAASAGIRFEELRAIAGASGAGTFIGADGTLRAAGVPAELTPDMPGILVGAWDRAGIIVEDEVTVLFERLGKAGHLACTAFVRMVPLVPDNSYFWTVA